MTTEANTLDRTTPRKQLEHGSHSDSLTVRIHQLKFHFQTYPEIQLARLLQATTSFLWKNQVSPCVATHGMQLQNPPKTRVTILGFFSLPLTFLALLALLSFPHSLCWSGTNSLSQSVLSSSTHDKQHPSRVYSDPLVSDLTMSFSPWPLFVFQPPARCTCRMLVSSGAVVLAKRHQADGGAQLPT